MSATLQEREANWKAWVTSHARSDLRLVGFSHWCGAATLVENWDDFEGFCSGCRYDIDGRRGDQECLPLWGLTWV